MAPFHEFGALSHLFQKNPSAVMMRCPCPTWLSSHQLFLRGEHCFLFGFVSAYLVLGGRENNGSDASIENDTRRKPIATRQILVWDSVAKMDGVLVQMLIAQQSKAFVVSAFLLCETIMSNV